MDLELGIVCGRCDTYNVMGTRACSVCSFDLALHPRTFSGTATALRARAGLTEPPSSFAQDPPVRRRSAGSQPMAGVSAIRSPGGDSAVATSGAFDSRGSSSTQRAAAPAADGAPSVEELMEQAKNFVCRHCGAGVPLSHKFCGRCGTGVPPEILAARTQFFGTLQTPGKAKLILIRGEGAEGLSYQLNAEQHIVGRVGQIVFADDPFISSRHANLFYRNDKLVVRDEGSLNGVFFRVRGTVGVQGGDEFLAGEQLFRLESAGKPDDGPEADGTYFYSSPKYPTTFRVAQELQGGASGMAVCARGPSLQIGREGGDLNFPGDLYMSGAHCRIDDNEGRLSLTDLNSRNGTYVRLRADRELGHGDYLFVGRKLLRVEITES